MYRHALAALVASVLFAVFAQTASSQPKPGKRKFALLVGVNVYDRRGFRDLAHAERDVSELAKVLRRQGYDVTLLPGKKATKAAFDVALKAIFAKKVKRNEIVLLGFAGHGFQMPLLDKNGKQKTGPLGKPLEDAYFAPVDATKGQPSSMISLTGLLTDLDTRGGVNLMLVDACRNDPNPGRGRSLTGNELQGRLPRNTALLFSCAAGQEALETKLAGGGHGVFFHHVLEALKGKAKDKRGRVTWELLVAHVKGNVNDRAKQWFPVRARLAAKEQDVDVSDALLQTPHALTNLIRVPPLGIAFSSSKQPLRPTDRVSKPRPRADKATTLTSVAIQAAMTRNAHVALVVKSGREFTAITLTVVAVRGGGKSFLVRPTNARPAAAALRALKTRLGAASIRFAPPASAVLSLIENDSSANIRDGTTPRKAVAVLQLR